MQTNDVTVLLLDSKSYMSCKNSSIDFVSTAQDRWNTKRLLSSNDGIFSKNWVEKNQLLLEKIELTHFKRVKEFEYIEIYAM